MQRAYCAQRNEIACCHDSVEPNLAPDQRVNRGFCRLGFELHATDQCVVNRNSRILQSLGVATITLRGLRIAAAEEQESPAPELQQMLSGALATQHVVRADRAVFLAGNLCAPDDESALGPRQPVEFLVQSALTQED